MIPSNISGHQPRTLTLTIKNNHGRLLTELEFYKLEEVCHLTNLKDLVRFERACRASDYQHKNDTVCNKNEFINKKIYKSIISHSLNTTKEND